MDIIRLQKEYEYATEGEHLSDGERVERNMNFVEILLSDNSSETINYHYNLLKKREYKNFYHYIRAAFKKRPEAEAFLLKRLSMETDPITLGEILHLLGGIRSSYATPLARQFVNNENDFQREVALYVLGWVGTESDIEILNEHLLSERSSHLRITAASAHRQMYWRLAELKNKLLASLKQGF